MVFGDKGLKDLFRMFIFGSLRILEFIVRYFGVVSFGIVYILGKDWVGVINVNVGVFLERCLGWIFL